jgi:hypothetical protein
MMGDELYDLFSKYDPDFQYHWNDVIHRGFEAFAEELAKLLPEAGLTQESRGKWVYWRDSEGSVQAMFAFVIDPTDLDGLIDMYQEIKRESIPLTFVIIEQKADGPRNYDIFRLSERSYMEHTNRAWPRGHSPDPL